MILKPKNTHIFYSSKGTGNPIVLLHGFLESSKIWDRFLPELEKVRQVITIDLPGHGRSENLGEVHSMEDMANVVFSVLQELKVSSACLTGHSMGGYVCLSFLENYPKMVKSIQLINSSPVEDSEERKINRERAITLVSRNKAAYIKMAISNLLTPQNREKFKKEVEGLKLEALNSSTEGIIAALKGMKIRTNKTEVLKNFNNRKLLVAGKTDPVMPYDQVKNIAKLCDCTLLSLPDGHLSYLENFSDIEQILHFID